MSMRSTRYTVNITAALGGAFCLLVLSTTTPVAVGPPAPPVGAYDDVKHDVARRGGGGGRMAGRGSGRRGGFHRGRGGGRAFKAHKNRFGGFGRRFRKLRRSSRVGRNALGSRRPQIQFRRMRRKGYHAIGARGPRYGLGRLESRRQFRHYVLGKDGRFDLKRGHWSNIRYGKYRRHKYGYRYRDRHGLDHRRRDDPFIGLPWAPYYAGAGTVEDFVCRKLYETALVVNNHFYWEDYYNSCDDPEAYAWFETYLLPPDLPLRK